MDFVHPEDQERTAAAAARLSEGAGNVVGFENRYRACDGGYRWLRWNTTSDGERELLYAVARDVTEDKLAERTFQGLNDGLIEAQEEIINRLLRAAEFRDDETGAHIARMNGLCERIGHRLGLGSEDCHSLRMAAAMHDIGKIAIPDDVLRKPGPLTAAERTVMQTHAEIGHQILQGSGIPILERAAGIALGHHERADGCGYPWGLAGDAIPLDSRIAAVADVFDALTSARVYRPAFSVDAALQMMREESGSHFDPVVLQALLDEIATTEPAGQACVPHPPEQVPDSWAQAAPPAQTGDGESHGLPERVEWRVCLEAIKRLAGNDTVMWRLELDHAGGSVDSVKGQRLAMDSASISHGMRMLRDGEVARVLVSAHAASLGPILASGILHQGLPTTATQLVVSVLPDGSSIAEIEHGVSALKQSGCLVAIAEFGSGDSLELAGRCRFDYVNLSRRMTDGIATRPAQQLTVRSMASLAEGLGASSVCDGIRTDEDADALRALGVELGTMISRAKPASLVTAVESAELCATERT